MRRPPKLTQQDYDSCPALKSLEEQWGAFGNSEGGERVRLLIAFCQTYLAMLSSAGCRNAVELVTPKVALDISKVIGEFVNEHEAISAALLALNHASAVCPFPGSFSELIYHICVACGRCVSLWHEGNPMIGNCAVQQSYACDLGKSPYLTRILKLAFLNEETKELGRIMNLFLFEQVNRKE